MSFQCAIVTPSDSVLDSKSSYVTFEAFDGQRGVADKASAFLIKLGVGMARVDVEGGEPRSFVLDGGFAQMDGKRLTLLTERALEVGTLDATAAQRELNEANAAVLAANDKPLTLEQRAGLERRQRLARAKLAAAGRTA
ncbi:MAG: F0F1 ATP synthase subunit epsilon [Phycisphaerae bacterium]|nr:F0F1 ATP synthase subunit epsilon [Phycisphaerae bacterium]